MSRLLMEFIVTYHASLSIRSGILDTEQNIAIVSVSDVFVMIRPNC